MRTNAPLTAADHRRLARFGDELQRRRLEVGLSQTELGAIAGVGWTRIRNWEQGLRRPTLDGIRRLVSAMYAAHRWALGLVSTLSEEQWSAMTDAEVHQMARSHLLDDEWEELEERLLSIVSTSIIEDKNGTPIDYAPIIDRAREWGRIERAKKGRR